MDDKLLLQPNSHSDVYRTLAPRLDVTTLEKYLDFIEISKDGHVLVGSSNLTGRTWYGSVWYYENLDLACQLTTYVANRTVSSGVVDGKFLPRDSTKVLVVDDSGCVQLMSLPENGDEPDDKLQVVKVTEEHEATITEIALFKGGGDNKFITCSMDCSIKLWDLECTRFESNEYLDSLTTYSNAHRDVITSIDTQPTSNSVFVSSALDRTALLWDHRVHVQGASAGDESTTAAQHTVKPAQLLYDNEFSGLTQIKWHPSNDHLVSVATEAGDVYVLDVRAPSTHLAKMSAFNRAVHRIKYTTSTAAAGPNTTLLAACADDNTVVVLNMSQLEQQGGGGGACASSVVYKNGGVHTDMVRGLAWQPSAAQAAGAEQLVTCGWDRRICKHTIQL